jgi:hypothetical protein
MNQTRDEHEAAPLPAILIRYQGDDWQGALDLFYAQNPGSLGQVAVVLLPKGGRFELGRAKSG